MKSRWTFQSVLSLSLSSLSLVAVAVLALVSCSTTEASRLGGADGSVGTTEIPQGGSVAVLETLQSSFYRISESVSPSVVRIDVRERVTQESARGGSPFFDFFFGSPDDTEPEDRGFDRGGIGSGVIIGSDGRTYHILTNDHVVGEADYISVVLDDGTELEGELVGRDPRKDLAMISVRSADQLTVARLGDSDSLRVGDWVAAIGSPFGYQNTLTVGIVSALGRRGGPANNISDFIQTDAAINQGNSGGALVNLEGEVVGINTWITSDSGGSIGLGFAIPINNVRRSVAEFLNDGEVEYGWLGVSIQTADAEQVESLELPNRFGALVNSVFADSPALKSGILPGDFIVMIDGEPIRNSDELVLFVGEVPVGEQVTFTLVRNGETITIETILTERQTSAAISQSYRQLWPGFSVYPLTDQIVEEAALDVRRGVVVSSVDPGTAADIGGLQGFDVITAVNGAPVPDLLSFYRNVADITLREWQIAGTRDGEEFEITVIR